MGGEQGTRPSGFLQQAGALFLWDTRAPQSTKYLDDQTVPSQAGPGSRKLAQRDNVSLWLICAWVPTPWHLGDNKPFLLHTKILFLVSLVTRQTVTVRSSRVCVCLCVREVVCVRAERFICLLSRDKGLHCSLAVHFTVTTLKEGDGSCAAMEAKCIKQNLKVYFKIFTLL